MAIFLHSIMANPDQAGLDSDYKKAGFGVSLLFGRRPWYRKSRSDHLVFDDKEKATPAVLDCRGPRRI